MSLSGSSSLQEEELGRHDVREVVGDLGAEEDDPLAQEAGVDVEGALAASVRLDHHRYQAVRVQLSGCA